MGIRLTEVFDAETHQTVAHQIKTQQRAPEHSAVAQAPEEYEAQKALPQCFVKL